MVIITDYSHIRNSTGPQPDKPPFVENYCYKAPYIINGETLWYIVPKGDKMAIGKPFVFTCQECYHETCHFTNDEGNVFHMDMPPYLKRCRECNSKFLRWKWRKKFRDRIPLRPKDRQWLATFTWGQPMVNATKEEREIILEAMKIAMQKLTKTKLWKEHFVGYVWVYEEAMHDESKVYITQDLFGNEIDRHTQMRLTHHPHIHAVLEKKTHARFSSEEFEQLKNHIRKYFAKYVWLKKIRGDNGTSKAINYTLKYISKTFGDYPEFSSRKVFIGGTWRETPSK